MKIYSNPIPSPAYDFSNCDSVGAQKYDSVAARKLESDYALNTEAKLRSIGYSGKLTGYIFTVPWADGHAVYMVTQTPKGAVTLTHLAVRDAWRVPDYIERGLRKADVVGRCFPRDEFFQPFPIAFKRQEVK